MAEIKAKIRTITDKESGKTTLFIVFDKFWLSEDQMKIVVESDANTVCDFGTNYDETEKKKLIAHDGEKIIFQVQDEIVGTYSFSKFQFLGTLFEREVRVADAGQAASLLANLKKSS